MMLDNPEMIQAAIRSNPQMRELMESNPEIGHMINNPQLMRQALEMTRNPSMMQVSILAKKIFENPKNYFLRNGYGLLYKI